MYREIKQEFEALCQTFNRLGICTEGWGIEALSPGDGKTRYKLTQPGHNGRGIDDRICGFRIGAVGKADMLKKLRGMHVSLRIFEETHAKIQST